jgi:hypothetical protein
MTQYMLAVIHDWDGPPMGEENMQKAFEQVEAFNGEITAQGKWVFGGGLTHPSSATVVRSENDETVLTDGPYLESKEHLGGFWVVEAKDLDEALDLAARASAACMGPVEVRPFQDEPA